VGWTDFCHSLSEVKVIVCSGMGEGGGEIIENWRVSGVLGVPESS
jgi:hypothetical protein